MLKPKHIYFLGIGGIGMSALARYYNRQGVKISGYDRTSSPLSKMLEAEGMNIHYQDEPSLIPNELDLVVWTPAIPKELKEFIFLSNGMVPMKKRSTVLGEISKGKRNIAIAGTHGKTTTSILLTHILNFGGVSVTAFLGGIGMNFESNFLDSGEDWIVEEADEYDRSFLQLHPDIAAIGSLDADHLDIYGTKEEMVQNYVSFASQIKPNGMLFLNDEIPVEESKLFSHTVRPDVQIFNFGFQESQVQGKINGVHQGWVHFDYKDWRGRILEDCKMRLPGKHNVKNALVSIAIAQEVGVAADSIKAALTAFKGIHRRFEWIYESPTAVLIDDYAHHPEEIKSAIQACRTCYPDRKITGIFQPHLYSRTKDFLNEFAEVLGMLDQLILVELYPAREKPIENISSKSIFDLIKLEDKYLVSKKDLINFLKELDTDVVMTLGAGDLDLMLPEIKECLSSKT